MDQDKRIPWQPVRPLTARERQANGWVAALEALRAEWKRHLGALSEAERVAVRQRSLRRLAIETGILERLYDVDWGLTLTLVAEGLTRDVVERHGGSVDESVLATLAAQRDSLELVLDYARHERALSRGFIKELHHAITRTQRTYTAHDALGRVFERELPHGVFKTSPNHVVRADGSLLEYCPPEHVDAEIDRLIEGYAELSGTDVHPIVQAAWLHHRFVQIHPFADGNGRVARALTLLTLEQHHYAPLVVDRYHRQAYLTALDAANDDDLQPLVRLFINLENAALANELERPAEDARGLALDVAHTLAQQLAARQQRQRSQVRQVLAVRAVAVAGRTEAWFRHKEQALRGVFEGQGVQVWTRVGSEQPPHSSRLHWFRGQVIDSARRAGHFADFGGYVSWCSLRLRAAGLELRFVASLHGAGRDTGVMALTTFAELVARKEQALSEAIATTPDAFRFVHTETLEDLATRGAELEDLLERGLTEALGRLLKTV